MKTLALASALIWLFGCVSYVSVEPYVAGAKGLPFSLAEPYLLVQPQPDGSATYTWHYLPNESRKYVARPVSFLARHTFEIEVEHGILKKASSKSEASDVASTLVEGVGTVEEAEEAASKEALQSQQERLDAATKSHQAAIDAAKTELNEANLEHAKALATEAIYREASASAEKLLEARVAVANAKARVDAATSALAQLTTSTNESALNAPAGTFNSPSPPQVRSVQGPVLFRVAQAADGTARLQAVTFGDATGIVQQAFPTAAIATPNGQASQGGVTFELDASDDRQKHSREIVIRASEPLDSVNGMTSTLTTGGKPVSPLTLSLVLRPDKLTIDVKIEPPLPAATYQLSPAYRTSSNGQFIVTNFLEFEVIAQ